MKRLIAIVLCLALVLSGCGGGAKNALGFSGIVKYSDMVYTHPNMEAARSSRDAAIEAAKTQDDADAVLEKVWDFYDLYDRYLTSYDMAYIRYHGDLTDIYWKDEHDYCAEIISELDMYLEEIYCAIAASPLRTELEEEYFGEGWFESYDDGGMYDETLLDMMAREQELVAEYYELTNAVESEYYTDAYFEECTLPMTEILAQLVLLRQELAAYLGYDSYAGFAWEFYYCRDYTTQEADAYLEEIRLELADLYRRANGWDVWKICAEPRSQQEIFSYVRDTAKAMGGVTEEAFLLLEEAELYDIADSPNKYDTAFSLYLTGYYEPFLFMKPGGDQWDKLTLAHEFGHFTHDYVCWGTYAGTDVAEVLSQGMEYLALCYGKDTEELTRMKLLDCLCVYVEQAAYADFEMQLYELPGEEITGENLLALYEQVCEGYGFRALDWDPRDMVTVPHFYELPHYVISYAVSNDAAMQLYEMELRAPGSGAECFAENLTTEAEGLMSFLKEAELKSPFDRIGEVKGIMEGYFGLSS
mgnify:CR=1 FL=1